MLLPDGRDADFVCMCGGNLVYTRTEPNGRKIYKCDKGTDGARKELSECTICHLPKSIWADDGNVCGGCYLRFRRGEVKLTEIQEIGALKWRIAVQPPDD